MVSFLRLSFMLLKYCISVHGRIKRRPPPHPIAAFMSIANLRFPIRNDLPMTLFGVPLTQDLFMKVSSLLFTSIGGRFFAK